MTMSSGSPKRTRSERVASLQLPPNAFAQACRTMQRGDVLLRVLCCFLAAAAMLVITKGWRPPFPYRSGDTPPRNIVARVAFQTPNPPGTSEAQEKARRAVQCVYEHDPRPLIELRQALKDRVFQVLRAESYEALAPELWDEFQPAEAPGADEASVAERAAAFAAFREAVADDPELTALDAALGQALAEFERDGLLESLQHDLLAGSQTEIVVAPIGDPMYKRHVAVDAVRIAAAAPRLEKRLTEVLPSLILARHLLAWLKPRLPTTLSFHRDATRAAADEAAAAVPPVMNTYEIGQRLAEGGKPLAQRELELLGQEHAALVAGLGASRTLAFTLASLGMYVALYTLCGFYTHVRHPRLLCGVGPLARLLVLVVVTLVLCQMATRDQWQAELIPLLLFAMIAVIAYQQELALLLSAAVSLVAVLTLGQGLIEYVITVASMSAAILLLRRVRSRTKLIYVGACAGAAAALTTLGVGTLGGLPLGTALLTSAGWFGFCTLLAGVLMTGILPFIEHLFQVQTEISLLELGDIAHPLLQELVRRAPGTYNHSINVASIAESAAEAIGANGLLVRVGAYFHDIGKMLKPGYFVENQGPDPNRHESLLPAMSTLIIIAHVKDGADLARQHHLPQPIIDFIQQHHGTTIVEYFYQRASKQRQEVDPESRDVDEGSFRYPGPKPQTREAGVMMLADAAESACRSLVDPAPSRIEGMVHELVTKRLNDGQFDECGLTLQELSRIENSLVKSLTAVYHGRVKYPDQESA